MKKNFPLAAPGKARARVVEAVKNEVRKYVRRERRKPLPAGFDEWTFACRVGPARDAPVPCEVPELGRAIDRVVNAGGAEVYVEIIATPTHRLPPPASAAGT